MSFRMVGAFLWTLSLCPLKCASSFHLPGSASLGELAEAGGDLQRKYKKPLMLANPTSFLTVSALLSYMLFGFSLPSP